MTPKRNDFVLFKFTPPIRLKSFLFKSGNVEHPGDRFYNTTVKALPVNRQNGTKKGAKLGRKCMILTHSITDLFPTSSGASE